MADTTDRAMPSLYDKDLALWARQQAVMLRDGQFEALDGEHLAEDGPNSRHPCCIVWKFARQPPRRDGQFVDPLPRSAVRGVSGAGGTSGASPPGVPLHAEAAAWQRQRNSARARVKWMFTTERARTKLAQAYPDPAKES
jgi:hypothetical protein